MSPLARPKNKHSFYGPSSLQFYKDVPKSHWATFSISSNGNVWNIWINIILRSYFRHTKISRVIFQYRENDERFNNLFRFGFIVQFYQKYRNLDYTNHRIESKVWSDDKLGLHEPPTENYGNPACDNLCWEMIKSHFQFTLISWFYFNKND